ncbi:MFS multidrug transporter [Colletotrichum camelliae]|nr:MFS multidrug transporter [Colletotrichum camelliae]
MGEGQQPMRSEYEVEVNDSDARLPCNWSSSKKWTNVLLISLLTLISPFGSSIFAPSTASAMKDFHQSENPDLEAFSVSIFVLGYAFGPLVHAPMSEMYGRLIIYHVNSVLFIISNVACALSTNLPMLIIFRFVTGLVGSSPLALGPASVAEIFKTEERGKALALWNLPVLLGPAIGPLVGSYLAAAAGWRWNFWFLAIAMSVILVATAAFLRESHLPTLLKRKARTEDKAREALGADNASEYFSQPQLKTFTSAIIRPSKLLFLSPIVFFLSVLAAINYGYVYIMFTTMSSTFVKRYDTFDERNVGLTYLAFGIGNVSGNIVLSVISDRIVRRGAARSGTMKPEYRLPPLLPGSLLVPAGLLLYGWTLERNVHWIAPLFGMLLIGFGTILIFVPINAYLVDAFTEYAASATAASTVLRSLGGGLLPLCGGRMYQALGDGIGNTILAVIGVVVAPVAFLIYFKGENLRKRTKISW